MPALTDGALDALGSTLSALHTPHRRPRTAD
ncbi:hypothetical protein RKD49_006828 [Streptomyces glaucescens]|jgi:hypothetical protein